MAGVRDYLPEHMENFGSGVGGNEVRLTSYADLIPFLVSR